MVAGILNSVVVIGKVARWCKTFSSLLMSNVKRSSLQKYILSPRHGVLLQRHDVGKLVQNFLVFIGVTLNAVYSDCFLLSITLT